jgi:hypothetical protein
MTVKEAKTKVCPFIQDGRVLMHPSQIFEGEPISSNIYCITCDCMAWVNTTLAGMEETEGYCKRLQ